MTKKITTLTLEQTERLPVFRDEWLRWGTSTERADRGKAMAAIMAMRWRIGALILTCDGDHGLLPPPTASFDITPGDRCHPAVKAGWKFLPDSAVLCPECR